MGKINFNLIAHNIKTTIAEHSPEILTGIGITGMVTAMVLAVKATPKALELIADATNEKANNLIETEEFEDKDSFEKAVALTPVEKVKSAWKCYIPAAVTGTVSIVCLIGASSVNHKRNAALVTAYTISETAFSEYRDKVIESIGEKKEREIRDEVAKDKIAKNPVKNCEVFVTEKGNTLCYDAVSGRYFRSDIDKIKKAENELNHRLISEMYISLNEFYYEVGLPGTKMGDELGWNIDGGLIGLDFSSQLGEDGTPCLVIDYRIAPRYEYEKLM